MLTATVNHPYDISDTILHLHSPILEMINLDTNRSECESSIVLVNVFAKSIRVRAYATEEVLESWKRRRKGGRSI